MVLRRRRSGAYLIPRMIDPKQAGGISKLCVLIMEMNWLIGMEGFL